MNLAVVQELLALDVAPFESRCLAKKTCGAIPSGLGRRLQGYTAVCTACLIQCYTMSCKPINPNPEHK